VVYGSDRVAIRFGTRFLIATSPSARGWTSDRAAACQYRLIPSGGGLVPAGSGDKKFAIYNMENDRYLVYKDGWLVWQKIDGTPGGPVASADFVPTELLFTGTTAYLTIKNIGNVRSSASQQIMKVIIQGQRVDFEVIQPVEPGASLRDTIRMNGPLSQCVLVEIDADPVKFQVLPGALPNDFVFLNDRRNMTARQLGSSTAIAQPPCEPIIVQ